MSIYKYVTLEANKEVCSSVFESNNFDLFAYVMIGALGEAGIES